MAKYRSIARHAFLLLMVLPLAGCLSDPDEDLTRVREDSTGDIAQLSLKITAPVSSTQMDTTDTSVSLAGEASSEQGIHKVTWNNDRGGDGVASGTSSWETGSIALALGDNEITVTAEDASGGKKSRSVKVKRESGQKGSATLSWSAPSTRVDGSPLDNLAGYMIDYGRMSGVYDYQIDVSNPGLLTYVVENLVAGEWFFAVAAYDSAGLVSEHSNEAVHTID